jgi:heme a synthase
MTMTIQPTPIFLRRYAKVVAACTLFLVYAGAMVTSTGSGLAVPDWPLSYGMLMPPMIAGIFYEHGHRMIAATVGLLTLIQAIVLQLREPKRFVRLLGWCSLGAVVVQGVLGGLTVLFLLPHAVSISHAGLAEIFLCLNMSIAFFTSESFRRLRAAERDDRAPTALTTLLVVLAYLQILAGALVRHLGAGLAIPDFPLSFGRIVPPFTSAAVAANFAHRLGATLVTITIVALAVRVYRSASAMRPLMTLLLGLISLQIYLGAKVVWFGNANPGAYHSLAGAVPLRLASITSFHVVTGAATLATSLLLALTARATASPRVEERAGAFVASEVAA